MRASANTEPGSSTGCTPAARSASSVSRGRGFKMVGGARAQLGGQSGSGAGAKLLGVHAQFQAMGAGGGEHSARFFHGEGVVVAKGVAEARQLEAATSGISSSAIQRTYSSRRPANSGGTVCAASRVGTMRMGPSALSRAITRNMRSSVSRSSP